MNMRVFLISIMVNICFFCLLFLNLSVSCNENAERWKDSPGCNDQCRYETLSDDREHRSISFGKEVRGFSPLYSLHFIEAFSQLVNKCQFHYKINGY